MRFSDTLKKNHEFRRLYSKGKSAVSPHLALYCRRNGRDVNRVGVTVGVKVGNAVVRNRVRRRLREIYRLNELRLRRGFDVVIVARVRSRDSGFDELTSSYIGLCRKLGLLKTEETL